MTLDVLKQECVASELEFHFFPIAARSFGAEISFKTWNFLRNKKVIRFVDSAHVYK